MALSQDHATANPTIGTTTVAVSNWGYGGTSQGCTAVIIGFWESLTIEGSKFMLDEGGTWDTAGYRAMQIKDTNLGVTAEVWYVSRQELYGFGNVGFLNTELTFTGTIPANRAFYMHSLIATTDEIGLRDEDSVLEQGSGDIGPNAVANGAVGDDTFKYMSILSNETSAANLTPVASNDWGNGGSNEAAISTGEFMGNYLARDIATTTQWGTTGMVVGGGSGGMVVIGEGGYIPGQGTGGGGSKAPPMQYPMGVGNWTMANGILTR